MNDKRPFEFRRLSGGLYSSLNSIADSANPYTGKSSEDLLREFNYVRRTEPINCYNYRTDMDDILVDDDPQIQRRPAIEQPEVRSEQKIGVRFLKPIPDVSFS